MTLGTTLELRKRLLHQLLGVAEAALSLRDARSHNAGPVAHRCRRLILQRLRKRTQPRGRIRNCQASYRMNSLQGGVGLDELPAG